MLRNVEKMSFAKIETEIKRLAAATRDGKLSLEELSGGTFTITNGGIFGSLLSTPILNPPQSGILGMHAIQKRPIVINDKIEIRSMMYVALSYDHRLVDGRESVSFLVRLKQFLEDPARLMLEILATGGARHDRHFFDVKIDLFDPSKYVVNYYQ